MKFNVFLLQFFCMFSVVSFAQITPELQNAINSVPFAKFDYPANRDRRQPPQVAEPQAFAFAYYQLPYAINLDMKMEEVLNTYVGVVLVDFESVSLSLEKEQEALRMAISGLKDLLSNQYARARLYGYYANRTYSYSVLTDIARTGDAVIAIREVLSTEALLDLLTSRMVTISK